MTEEGSVSIDDLIISLHEQGGAPLSEYKRRARIHRWMAPGSTDRRSHHKRKRLRRQ